MCPNCQGVLRANVGRRIERRHKLVWWRCEDCDAMTDAIPVPPGVNHLSLAELLKSPASGM